MSIKSKNRRKRGGRRSGGAPAPKHLPKPVPWHRRPAVRRTAVGILALAAVMGGLRVWQNASRAHSLRLYVAALTAAQAPAAVHLRPASDTYVETTARKFIEANTTSAEFKKIAETWEDDFRGSRDAVKALRPPPQLRQAHRLLVAGLDQYIGVARLYNLAAQQRDVAAKLSGDALQQVENKVQVTLTQAQEWVDRAGEVYSLGGRILERYELVWLGTPETNDVPGVPKGLVPPEPTQS